jgi:RNA polymerase sigma factor (sigma-70 family)
MSKEDPILIKKILAGDKAAMQALYEKHNRFWFRLCLRYGRNKSEAEDILQEGLIGVFKDLSQFDAERGAFRSWSNRVMVNAALRYLKKYQWQQSFEDLTIVNEGASVIEDIMGKITVKELTQVIQQLPSGYRMVFNMYEIEGYSHKEIAEILNISIGTSKSQLSKAKKYLRGKLEILFLN